MTKITIDRSTVKQALEVLETCDAAHLSDGGQQWYDEKLVEPAITALRAALAEPQEPAPMPLFPPVPLWKRGCAVCGIGAGGHAYGYACPRSDCPTRVTCGGGAV